MPPKFQEATKAALAWVTSSRKIRETTEAVLSSGSTDVRRPVLKKGFQSSVPGLHVIGDLAGAPVIKLAMEQGVQVIEHLAALPEMRERPEGDVLDALVVGAGAAGLNAALAAADKGWRYVVLEKNRIANTIEDFPEGKWVYAEPDTVAPKGKLWLDGATKEELVGRWHAIIEDNNLDVRVGEPLTSLERQDGLFVATTPAGTYRARKIVLATGQRGNPRKLGVAGEDTEIVYHRLYSPRKYQGEEILVVGGGNSAVEAALVLSEANKVRLSYRRGEFSRLFKDNRRKLDEAVSEGRIELILNSEVREFRGREAELQVDRGGHQESVTVRADHAFVLIGAEMPVRFLKSLGIRLENEWTGVPWRSVVLSLATLVGLWFAGGQAQAFGKDLGFVSPWLGGLLALAGAGALIATGWRGDRWSWLGLSFLIWYSVYGIKYADGNEFWPFEGWGSQAMTFFDRPWSFWYTVIYTLLMTAFGFQAMKRWGLDRKDKFQVWRYITLLGFQWVFFFLLPEFLFQWAVEYQWVGEALAQDPKFAGEAWRTYGVIYAWPLFFYTFFYDPHMIWVVWGVAMTFVVLPIFVLFQGKRYCSWICGCGGLAETFGDRWRHLAPKGMTSIRLERMSIPVVIGAVLITLAMLLKDSVRLFQDSAQPAVDVYHVIADVWLVGILPVTVYPFLGGKVWCRYWCPLAKLMEWSSKVFTKLGISRFAIHSNDKCIACNECSRNCQVGIPVMDYALKQEVLDNANTSCIGCGICVTVCPMDTLSFDREDGPA